MGGQGRMVLRKNYKGHMYKTRESGIRGGRWEWLGWGELWGVNCSQLYLNNSKIILF